MSNEDIKLEDLSKEELVEYARALEQALLSSEIVQKTDISELRVSVVQIMDNVETGANVTGLVL
jgi:hypothetical protein